MNKTKLSFVIFFDFVMSYIESKGLTQDFITFLKDYRSQVKKLSDIDCLKLIKKLEELF